MGVFKRCDKCGAEIEPLVYYPKNIGEKAYEALANLAADLTGKDTTSYRISHIDRDGDLIRIIDLCPKCQARLVKWLKEAENEND